MYPALHPSLSLPIKGRGPEELFPIPSRAPLSIDDEGIFWLKADSFLIHIAALNQLHELGVRFELAELAGELLHRVHMMH